MCTKRGFTLIEVIIVIVGTLTGLFVANLAGVSSNLEATPRGLFQFQGGAIEVRSP